MLSLFSFESILFIAFRPTVFLPRDALQCKARSCYHMSSVRPSVCLSVTVVDHDHIGWKSWKLIAQTISLTFSLFAAQRSFTYSLGEHAETWGRLEVGWEKVACWSTIVAISLKRVKREEKLLWRAYRKSPMLFRFFRSPPYFYFRFRLYGHRFCLIFARTA